jgi:hypothetical protein
MTDKKTRLRCRSPGSPAPRRARSRRVVPGETRRLAAQRGCVSCVILVIGEHFIDYASGPSCF